MNTRLIAIAALALALAFSGCSFTPGGGSSLQRVLDHYLPREFVGDIEIHHNNPYVPGIDIRAGNVRWNGQRWIYDWLAYNRVGHVSNGWVYLGNVPESVRK